MKTHRSRSESSSYALEELRNLISEQEEKSNSRCQKSIIINLDPGTADDHGLQQLIDAISDHKSSRATHSEPCAKGGGGENYTTRMGTIPTQNFPRKIVIYVAWAKQEQKQEQKQKRNSLFRHTDCPSNMVCANRDLPIRDFPIRDLLPHATCDYEYCTRLNPYPNCQVGIYCVHLSGAVHAWGRIPVGVVARRSDSRETGPNVGVSGH